MVITTWPVALLSAFLGLLTTGLIAYAWKHSQSPWKYIFEFSFGMVVAVGAYYVILSNL
jgi:hypothetical protein